MLFFFLVLLPVSIFGQNLAKCSDNNDCELILSPADRTSPDIFAVCDNGICGFAFIKGIGGFDRTAAAPNVNCVDAEKMVPTAVAKCKKLLKIFASEFRNIKVSFVKPAYICSLFSSSIMYLSCSFQAGGTPVPENAPECKNPKFCDAFLSTADQSNKGIIPVCFEADPNCKSNCKPACGYNYLMGINYTVEAKSPINPLCDDPPASDVPRVKEICTRYLKIVKSNMSSQFKVKLVGDGYICPSTSNKKLTVVTCSTQVNVK